MKSVNGQLENKAKLNFSHRVNWALFYKSGRRRFTENGRRETKDVQNSHVQQHF